MSFGLTNALTYFMDMVDKVYKEYLDKLIIKFIGGILIYSKGEEEHEEHLHLVLQKLRDHRLYAKLSKCEFWMKQVTFLSHVISEEGISMDSSKIQNMLSCNAPTSDANICRSLGLVGYYQRFIKGFLKITKPITELLGKDKQFK
jgi:hypothetical protein